MAILNERIASPKEVAAATGEALNKVAYHIEVLRKLKCIELVETRPAASGRVVEHFYRAALRPMVDQGEWEELDDSQKYGLATTTMRLISEDVNLAMKLGTFLDPDDGHLTRTAMTVDRQGWEETVAILDEALKRLFDVQENAAGRIGKSSSDAMLSKVAIVHFRSPDSE